jgi:hypothetical protein
MKSARIFNKIITTLILAGVVLISIPQGTEAQEAHSAAYIQQMAALQAEAASLQAQVDAAKQRQQANKTASVPSTNTSSNKSVKVSTNKSGKADAQAEAASGDTSGVSGSTAGAGGGVADALGCSAASLLGQAVASGLKSLASRVVGKVVSVFTTVPISATSVGDNIDRSANASDATASVSAFQQIFGIPFGASFNGIAYCIVNGLITYIANSTIAWANSGFNGNPAFIQNPEGFFNTLADQQASQFISSVAYNTTGVNICQPFRVELAVALSQSYGQQGGTGLSCTMSQINQNVSNFANGGIGGSPNVNGYWSNWNQMRQDQNNPWGAYMKAGDYMQAQISVKQNTAKLELGLNNGFLNFKKCEDPAAAKKGDDSSCKTTTPGRLIESQLNSTLNLGKERLVMADKIDQVITAVANALVKKALNTVLQSN